MRRSPLAVVLALAVASAGCSPEPAGVSPLARSWSGATGPRAGLVELATSTTTPAPERDVRMGEPAPVGDWVIRVVGVDVDATDEVLAENQFNSPPPTASRFTMVTLEASYVGSRSASFWLGPELRLQDEGGERTTFDPSCGVIPDGFGSGEEVFPGGTVVGNVCWVLADNSDGPFTMTARDPFVPDGVVVRFTIDADAPVVEGTTTPDPLPALDLPVTRFGESVDVGGWRMSVVDYTGDATGLVMAENQFNDPPPDGEAFVIVRIRAERLSATPGSLFAEVTAGLVGPSRVARGPFTTTCGVIPDPLSDLSEAAQGAVLEGNLCWSLETSDADGPVLFLTEFATGQRAYLALSRS